MRVTGVKANDYNATYETTVFEVIERGELYEILDTESGVAFFIEKGVFSDKGRSETRVVRFEGNVEGHKVH